MKTFPEQEVIDFKQEYDKLNKHSCKDLSRHVIIGMIMIILIEAIAAFFDSRIFAGIGTIGMIIGMIIGLNWIWTSKENYDTIIAGFFFFFYLSGIFIYSQDKIYLEDAEMTFFFAYSCALSERLMAKVMADLHQRIIFTIFAVVVRISCMPVVDYVGYLKHLIPVILTVVIDICRENRSKQFFYSYFNSREQLSKFKNLVVQHIPEAIVIVSQDLSQSLFVNNSYVKLLQDNEFNIKNQFDQFIVREEMKKGPQMTTEVLISGASLLDFIKNNFTGGNSHPQKHKCIVSLMNYNSIENSPRNGDEDPYTKQLFEVKLFQKVWDDKAAIALIFHDITEDHTILSLKIADAQKDKILATVSHELRTPLNGMLGMIQVMEKKIQDSELLRFLAICKSSTNLLVNLVSSILDLNQLRANTIKLNYDSINIRSFFKDIVSLFEYQCQQKGLYLCIEIAPGTPSFLYSDKDRLSQILINLIGNAQKFTSQGGIILKASRDEDADSVKFSVTDTGIGISDKDKKRLFQVFGKLSQKDEKINRQGVGLGLTIAESLVKALNKSQKDTREITVDSQQGRGSTFSFAIKSSNLWRGNSSKNDPESVILPTIPNETGLIHEKLEIYTSTSRDHFRIMPALHKKSISCVQSPQSTKNFKTSTPTLNTAHTPRNRKMTESTSSILLVDDDLFNIAVAEHLILSHGYKIITALSGQEAIDKLMKNNEALTPIILILMDCQMPIMDGYETTRRLSKLMQEQTVPRIPIVALTANDTEADKEACRKSGMCDYLSKPLKDEKLMKVLKKYC